MQNSWVRMDIINLSRTLPLALHIDMQSSWVRMDTTGRHIDDIGAAKLRRRRFAAKKPRTYPPTLLFWPSSPAIYILRQVVCTLAASGGVVVLWRRCVVVCGVVCGPPPLHPLQQASSPPWRPAACLRRWPPGVFCGATVSVWSLQVSTWAKVGIRRWVRACISGKRYIDAIKISLISIRSHPLCKATQEFVGAYGYKQIQSGWVRMDTTDRHMIPEP